MRCTRIDLKAVAEIFCHRYEYWNNIKNTSTITRHGGMRVVVTFGNFRHNPPNRRQWSLRVNPRHIRSKILLALTAINATISCCCCFIDNPIVQRWMFLELRKKAFPFPDWPSNTPVTTRDWPVCDLLKSDDYEPAQLEGLWRKRSWRHPL